MLCCLRQDWISKSFSFTACEDLKTQQIAFIFRVGIFQELEQVTWELKSRGVHPWLLQFRIPNCSQYIYQCNCKVHNDDLRSADQSLLAVPRSKLETKGDCFWNCGSTVVELTSIGINRLFPKYHTTSWIYSLILSLKLQNISSFSISPYQSENSIPTLCG